ncbi:lysis protein [Xenorhabdus anantnagensis]|uniref:Lysis protein n=1 Tax=Xenorhabdus anantnagensis TaxID=3025875 RepID=A0ABT5LYD5_9GAMM|nr:lysis protein [Xenorhabdus anantnagensis]MDC9598853.1 lysis protein [Xenorhabdus anantnagensis]
MKLNSQYFTLGTLVIVSGLFWFYYSEYQDKAEEYHNLKLEYDEQVAITAQQQAQIQHLAELDTRYIQELAHAKSKIDQLSDDLRTNTQRVFVKAECPVRETSAPSGVDSSRPARLEKDAEQDYVRLLGELETLEAQFLGLRDYVNTECKGGK